MNCMVHGILQARILEWVPFPFSSGSSQGSNPGLLHCRILYQLSHEGSPPLSHGPNTLSLCQSRGPLHPDAQASPAHPRSRSGFWWQPRPPWPSSPAPPVAAAQPAAAALPGVRRRRRQAVTDQGSARPSSAPAPAAPAQTTGARPPQPRAQRRARGSHTPGPPYLSPLFLQLPLQPLLL